LRNIRQTSYSAFYPAATHNRFVHSLGVYHLGTIAIEALIKSIRDAKLLESAEVGVIETVFKYACLLHDVGHAPFSHTTEHLYPSNIGSKLYTLLEGKYLGDTENAFETGISEAAPHEIMSAYIALIKFSEYFDNKFKASGRIEAALAKALFVRCITGYSFNDTMSSAQDNNKMLFQIFNSVIELLHSDSINVDSLDYLIRDAQTIGFQNVAIDYRRLLDGVCIVNDDGKYALGFNKSSVSVIQSYFTAHDNEKRWLQNNAVPIYEGFILLRSIQLVHESFKVTAGSDEKNVFNADSLLEEGVTIGYNPEGPIPVSLQIPISLLADEDVLFLMKLYSKYNKNSVIAEFFSRDRRRKPLWKNEAEYREFFHDVWKKMDRFCTILQNTHRTITFSESDCAKQADEFFTVNSDCKKIIEKQYQDKSSPDKPTTSKVLKFIKELESIAQRCNVGFDFVIVKSKLFKSKYESDYVSNIRICFPKENELCSVKLLNDVCPPPICQSESGSGKDMYYIYYRPGESDFSHKTKLSIVSQLHEYIRNL
jgi:HD superfamily phosphohydrolase